MKNFIMNRLQERQFRIMNEFKQVDICVISIKPETHRTLLRSGAINQQEESSEISFWDKESGFLFECLPCIYVTRGEAVWAACPAPWTAASRRRCERVDLCTRCTPCWSPACSSVSGHDCEFLYTSCEEREKRDTMIRSERNCRILWEQPAAWMHFCVKVEMKCFAVLTIDSLLLHCPLGAR